MNTLSDCSICLEYIQPNINYVITNCSHRFHTKCLLINTVYNGFVCPYCRVKMIEIDTNTNYEKNENEENEANATIFIYQEEDDEDEDNDIFWTYPEYNDENSIRIENRALYGMRNLFSRAEQMLGENNNEFELSSCYSDISNEESEELDLDREIINTILA